MGSKAYEHAEVGWAHGDVPTVVLTGRALPKHRDSVEFYAGDLPELVNQRLKPSYRGGKTRVRRPPPRQATAVRRPLPPSFRRRKPGRRRTRPRANELHAPNETARGLGAPLRRISARLGVARSRFR